MVPHLAPASHLPGWWVHPSPRSLPQGQPEGHKILTPLTTTQGTYSWGGCRASVSWAFMCKSWVPRSPVAHSMMASGDSFGA